MDVWGGNDSLIITQHRIKSLILALAPLQPEESSCYSHFSVTIMRIKSRRELEVQIVEQIV